MYDPADDPLVNPPTLFTPYPAERPQSVDSEATLVRYLFSEPLTLNPLFASNWDERYLAESLFDPLVLRDARLEHAWNPDLVAAADTGEARRIWDVTLREGPRWDDGRPITAHDVAFTFSVLRDSRVAAAGFKHIPDRLEEVRVVDRRTVRFVHRDVLATAMENMRFPILPRHVYGLEERERDPTLRSSAHYDTVNREGVVGNGPLRLVEWLPDDRLILERRDEFHSSSRRPAFRRVVFKIQPDRNLALLEFQQGQLDELILNAQQFATQTAGEAFARVGVKGYAPLPRFAYVGWNLDPQGPFFADPRVRRAMAHAYPAKRVLRDVSYDLFAASTGLFGRDHWAHDPDIELYEHDLEAANQLLSEAGWLPSPEDGWRRRSLEGRDLRFAFEILAPASFATGLRALVLFQDELRKLGVEMEIRPVENAAFVQSVRHGEFHAYINVADNAGDPDEWAAYLASDEGGARNWGGYADARVDELFRAGRRELDRDRRKDIYREIHRRVYEDQPFLPLWQAALLWAFDRNLRGVQFSPAGPFLFTPDPPPGTGWKFGPGWWIPKDSSVRPGE